MDKNVFRERDGKLSSGPRKRMGIQRPKSASDSGSDGLSKCGGPQEGKRSLRHEQGCVEPSHPRAGDSAWTERQSERNCSRNGCGRIDNVSPRSGDPVTSEIWN